MSDETRLTQDEIDVLWHPSGTDYTTVAQRGIQLCRTALAAAKTRNCPHGVGWRDCHQHNGHVIAGQVITEETE
jgi:hypothetical protein